MQKLIALFVLDHEPCHEAHLHVVPPSPPMGARERALLSTCTTACCWPQCGAMPLFGSFIAMKPAYAGRLVGQIHREPRLASASMRRCGRRGCAGLLDRLDVDGPGTLVPGLGLVGDLRALGERVVALADDR